MAQGRRLAEAGQAPDASAALGEALGLRRGEPLADFTYAGLFDAERTRLDELTLVAIETRAGADLALGRDGELAAELEAWCRVHPLRERLWELLILALYRAGRQAAALQAYTEVRDRLAASSALTPARRCATCRPASWPSTPRSALNRSRPYRPRPRQQPCSRRSCMSRSHGGAWCRVRG